MKKPCAYNPKIVGFIKGTLIKAQGFLIRFLHYSALIDPLYIVTLIDPFKGTLIKASPKG